MGIPFFLEQFLVSESNFQQEKTEATVLESLEMARRCKERYDGRADILDKVVASKERQESEKESQLEIVLKNDGDGEGWVGNTAGRSQQKAIEMRNPPPK